MCQHYFLAIDNGYHQSFVQDANESGEDNRSKSRELVADCIIELLKAEASK